MGFTTTTAQVGPLDATIQVVDPSVFKLPETVVLDGELIRVVSFTGLALNVDANGRGYMGTIPGLHQVGEFVDAAPSLVGTPNGITIPGYIHTRRVGEQWDMCDRCGFSYPMSMLVKQKGLLVCIRMCFDDLTVERRQQEIMKILGAGVSQEGADLRVIDRSFWLRSDEEVT